MPTIQHSWECDICKQTYLSIERAQSCENQHTPLNALKIVRIMHDNAVSGFPAHVEMEVNSDDGVDLLGTYELIVVYNTINDKRIYDKDKYRYGGY